MQHRSAFKSSQSITKTSFHLILLLGIVLLSPLALADQKENKALTQSEIIDQATSQSADAHIITKNKDSSVRIPSPMQDVIATLTAKGASIHSDDEAGEDFALLVNGLGRDKNKLTKVKPGKINSDEKIARLIRDNLIEEFSTSSEGIRQDFVIPTAPKGKGKLVLELDVKGASVALNDKGVQLTLKSGRELAYHNLLVADALGKTLDAHFAVKDNNTLHIVVDDKGAQYPVRIDPTITDADWFALSPPLPVIKSINALASDGVAYVYAGGSFPDIPGDANSAYISKWDGSSWSALGSGMNDSVRTLVWDGSNLYAGGWFTSAGGVPANYVAKWDGTSWSALGSGMDKPVRALTWDGSNLYAGGSFTSAGGVPANFIAKWDGASWSALDSGLSGSSTLDAVRALAWDGTSLYAGGDFDTADGVAVKNIAKWDGTSWSPLGSGINGSVYALVWDGANLHAGGAFFSAGEISARHVAKWDGTNWSALGLNVLGSGQRATVYALAWDGTNLYVGGSDSGNPGNRNDEKANGITKWDGTNWSSLNSMTGDFRALTMHGATLYAAGGIDMTPGGIPEPIAKWNGASWKSLQDGLFGTNAAIHSIAWDGSNLYAGGSFTMIGNIHANRIAKWDGSNWSAMGSGMNSSVTNLLWNGSKLFAGGAFDNAGGVLNSCIVQWDGTSWSGLGREIDGIAEALAWGDNRLYAGGRLFFDGEVTYFAIWDGTSWSGLNSTINDSVKALLWNGTHLYVGGSFTRAGADAVNGIARWNGSRWHSFGSGVGRNDSASPSVSALAWDGSNLYIGGDFTSVSGTTANGVAKWDGTTWSALGSGAPGIVESLTWNKNTLYAAGRFHFDDGKTVDIITHWDGSDWRKFGSGYAGDFSTRATAMLFTGDTLYVSGYFTKLGNLDVGYLAGVFIDPVTPNPLIFTNLSDLNVNTAITSETLNITGLGNNADITITAGEYRLNGGAFTSTAGTVTNGDTLQLRTTSSANYKTTTDVTVNIGNGSYTWSVTTQVDDVPDAFSFIDQADVALSTLTTSDTVIITGLVASSPVSITGGDYKINTGSYTSIPGLINNNDSVTLRTTSSATASTAINVELNIGDIIDTFTVTTEADTVPDAFAFVDQTDVALSTLTTSNTVTITGLGAASALSIVGGEYSINGGAFTSAGGFVSNNDTVAVRTTSSASFITAVDVVLTAGGISDTFTVTTLTDTVPDAFAFVDQTDAALSTLTTSNTVTITGLGAASALSIVGGEYSINGGAFTSAGGFVSNNDTVAVRTTSSASFITAVDVVLTAGGISDTFTVTTLTDTVPDAFAFVDQTGVALSTLTTSNAVTLTGLGAASAVSISRGEYSVNGGSFGSNASFVNNNDTVAVRTTSSASFNTAVDVVLTVGGVNDTFTVSTEADTDGDGDGVGDSSDAFPNDATETADIDDDGVGDNADAFPNDATETTDTDDDGVGDNADAFPNNNAASVDENNNGNPDKWNAACDTSCQNNSGLALDSSDSGTGSGGGGSTNPLLLSLFTLLVVRVRRRTVI